MRPSKKREIAKYAIKKFSCSVRKACKLLGLKRSSFDYADHPKDDSLLRDSLQELACKNRRFGHPRLHLLLKREKGMIVNHKRSYRVYKELALQIKNRKRKKLGENHRNVTPLIPYGTGDVLAIDFVFDYLETGRRLKILTMVDERTKISPGIMVDHSIKGKDLGPFIELACEKLPKVIRVDQGTEFTSKDFLNWAYKKDVKLDFTR